jgi:hypothetical protein
LYGDWVTFFRKFVGGKVVSEKMVDETNNKNQSSVVSLKDDIDKLTIFFIKRIIENLDKLVLTTNPEKDTYDHSIAVYGYYLRRSFKLLYNDFSGSTAFLLLPKLLFKDLSIFKDFCECGFKSAKDLVRVPARNTKEDVENYLRVLKINFVSYCKILLKEFDLMRFCKQCMKIYNIKPDSNFFYHKFKLDTLEKVEKINSLLQDIHYVLEVYESTLFTLYTYPVVNRLTLVIGTLSPIFYYIAFYYRVKLVKLLLKQYKKVINNEELKKNINIRLFTHFSITLIFINLSLAIHTAATLIDYYFVTYYRLPEYKNIKNLEKVLNKTVEILDEFYSVIFKGKEEKDMSLLLPNNYGRSYVDYITYETNWLEAQIEIIRGGLINRFMPLVENSSGVGSSEEYLQAERILNATKKIHSIASLIIKKFDITVEVSRCQ